jgi:UDP-N-acetylmuramoyl-L-alanyl-D-glutamate--2,6-diaminopimelate ligase
MMSAVTRPLADLLADVVVAEPGSDAAVLSTRVSGVVMDSRRTRPGDLFLAVPGRSADGRRFIADAVSRGATAICVDEAVVPADVTAAAGRPVIAVRRLAAAVSRIAGEWFDTPSRALAVLGVTGTNGKTSCTHHLVDLLSGIGHRAALCGTLGNGFPGRLHGTGLTTPDPVTLQASLAWMRDAGAQWVAMEVSSHALDQERVSGVCFRGALMTNLTRDHLDYHGTMDAYGEAKRKLFLAPGLEVAALNRDDAFTASLHDRMPSAVDCFDFSLVHTDASLSVATLRRTREGALVGIRSIWGAGELRTQLLGDYSLSNLLGSITLLAGLGLPLDALLAAADVKPVPGRLQTFDHPRGFTLVVDYAHTPDALAQALSVVRGHFPGRVICVVGCGGERDTGKRPQMGQVAEAGADVLVLTDDNPRGEDGDRIIAGMLSGMSDPGRALVERDRGQAIALACHEAHSGDVVLIAGKGHENYQDGAGGRIRYSDIETVRELIHADAAGAARSAAGA